VLLFVLHALRMSFSVRGRFADNTYGVTVKRVLSDFTTLSYNKLLYLSLPLQLYSSCNFVKMIPTSYPPRGMLTDSSTDQRVGDNACGNLLEQKVIDGIIGANAVQIALKQLHVLWTDLGVESKECTVCEEIARAVQRALQPIISNVQEAKAQTTLKIRIVRNSMQAIYMQLGVAEPNTGFARCNDVTAIDSLSHAHTQRGEDWMSLRQQLEKLQGMLAAAEVQRAKRLDVFMSKTAELRELLLEEYGELDAQSHACLDLSGETDLSDSREKLLVEAIAKGRKARGARARDIEECIAAIRTLWEVLGADEEEQSLWSELDADGY